MSNPPNNPSESSPSDGPGNPWIYSGSDTGHVQSGEHYAPPASQPVPNAAPATPTPAAASAAQPSSAAGVAAAPARAQAAAVSPAPAPDTAARHSDASLASIIDTIEAIIIALIIALTFRAVIVEAFVIPTGSMAPTLLGAHFKVICPKCGYEFDVETDLNKQVVMRDGRPVFPDNIDPLHQELRQNYLVANDGQPVYCPNCRNPILAADGAEKGFPQFLQNRQIGFERLPLVWANNGDRILVLKYLYSIMNPHRWDVIVFKEPQEAKDNFIKRLIGLPGETIEIVNGDIYVGPRGDPKPEDRLIQRKPEYIQPYLWQLVYDNDFYPIDENKPRSIPIDTRRNDRRDLAWTNPWERDARTAAGWKLDPDGRLGTTPTYTGNGPSALNFNIRPAYTEEAPYTLNTLGYNNDQYIREANPAEFAPRSLVGDLRLETLWRPQVPDAAGISMTLGRPNNCYRITWNREGLVLDFLEDPSTGKFKRIAGALVDRAPGAPQQGKAYSLAFENVDHAVRFYIDGSRFISYEPKWDVKSARDDAEKYPPDWSVEELSRDPEIAQRANTRISIDIAGPCTLAHLKLLRDLYYTQVLSKPNIAYPHTATEGYPLTLQDDEFFALGDNSRRSADGRLWGHVYAPLNDLSLRDGIVPRRYLLGKAFFVYWPAGFRASTTIGGIKDLPIVPNTGDMRIIR